MVDVVCPLEAVGALLLSPLHTLGEPKFILSLHPSSFMQSGSLDPVITWKRPRMYFRGHRNLNLFPSSFRWITDFCHFHF